MVRGRKPKPLVLHKIEGTVDPRVHSTRTDDRAKGRPRKPRNLDEDASELWELVQAAVGAATRAIDGPALAELCRLYSRLQEARQCLEIDVLDRNARDGYLKLLAQWHKLGSDFGLTPAARCRMTLPKDEQDDTEKRYFG
jgi:phage terminase small subunit